MRSARIIKYLSFAPEYIYIFCIIFKNIWYIILIFLGNGEALFFYEVVIYIITEINFLLYMTMCVTVLVTMQMVTAVITQHLLQYFGQCFP